jgi:hypothetical protein
MKIQKRAQIESAGGKFIIVSDLEVYFSFDFF